MRPKLIYNPEMIDEIEPRCPNCDYDLRGLPIPHHCPECGTHVDVVQTVWKPTRDSIAHWSIWFRLLIVLVVALFSLAFVSESRLALGISICVISGLVALAVAIIFHENWVTFEPGGLCLRRPFSRECIKWERISHFGRSRARLQKWSIELKNPSESRQLPPVLSDSISVRDFHRSLALAKARWGRNAEPELRLKTEERPRAKQRWGDLTGVLRDPRRNGPCPWCNYELTGHPAKSVCPSCGNEYSPALRVWKAPRRFEKAGIVIALTPLAGWGVFVLVQFFRGPPMNQTHKFAGGVLFMTGMFIAFLLEKWAARDGLVMAYEFGVEVRRFQKTVRIPWRRVLGARREGANVVLTTDGGPRRIDRFFENAGDAEDFVRHAERLITAQHAAKQ